MIPSRLETPEALDAVWTAPRFLLFKHSPACPTSARAFVEFKAFAESAPAVALGWIDVIGQREESRRIADRTGIRHESPQAILLEEGRPIWHASHFEISSKSLARAFAEVWADTRAADPPETDPSTADPP